MKNRFEKRKMNWTPMFFVIFILAILILIGWFFYLFLQFGVGEFVYDNQEKKIGEIKGVSLPVDYIIQWQDGDLSRRSLLEMKRLKRLTYAETLYFFLDEYDNKYFLSQGLEKNQFFESVTSPSGKMEELEEFEKRYEENFVDTIGGPDCTPEVICGEWGECKTSYDLDTIILNEFMFGVQYRFCRDYAKCITDFVDSQKCISKSPVYTKRVEMDDKDFLEIYTTDNVLVSRLNLEQTISDKLNVQMLFGRFDYPSHCNDGVKNYGEDEIDCSLKSDGVCDVCTSNFYDFYVQNKYLIILFIGIVLLLILISYLVWARTRVREI